MNNINKMMLAVLAISAAAMISLPYAMAIVPGEFTIYKIGGIGVGAGNITSGQAHGISWTANGSGEVNLEVDKNGNVDRFKLQLFVDTNNNEMLDNGEMLIFEGPLYMIKREYKFSIQDSQVVRLNYWYIVEKTFTPDSRVNKINLMLDFKDTSFQ